MTTFSALDITIGWLRFPTVRSICKDPPKFNGLPKFYFQPAKVPRKREYYNFCRNSPSENDHFIDSVKQSKLAFYNLFPYLEGQGGMKNVKCYSQDFASYQGWAGIPVPGHSQEWRPLVPVPELWEWIFSFPSRSRISGMSFFIPFPFPNFGNGFFHSLPVPELWEWKFFIPFPFPNWPFQSRESKGKMEDCERC